MFIDFSYTVQIDDEWVFLMESKSKGELISILRKKIIENRKLKARLLELEKINPGKELLWENETKQ